MSRLSITAALAAASITAAASASPPPTQVVRYHLGDQVDRGTVAIQPASPNGPESMEFSSYAAAVQDALIHAGYSIVAPGQPAQYAAIVEFRHTIIEGPRRRGFSLGLGLGGFSGGRGGGVGLGTGVGIPIGSGRGNELIDTDLSVTIKRNPDAVPIWEGHARGIADTRARDATADGQAHRLAAAMFSGFPGESGRTIEVKRTDGK